MRKLSTLICILVASFALSPAALGKTDVRALVSRPPETSKREERRCKVDADCLPLSCHAHCGFDAVVNKKSYDKVAKRCGQARDSEGDKIVVDCTATKAVTKVFCKKRYCVMTETFPNEPVLVPNPQESDDDH